MLGVLGVIYGILLSFAVIVVWEQYDEAKATVEQEATQIGDLAHLAKGFPAADRDRILSMLVKYTKIVIEDEWVALARRTYSPQARKAIDEIWSQYLLIEPKTEREKLVYAESLANLNRLCESRRDRLYASTERMPAVMWVLLCGGGIITLLFTYFFGVESLTSQALMTAGLTIIIALVLVLIFGLNQPFDGMLKIHPTPFRETLVRIDGQA